MIRNRHKFRHWTLPGMIGGAAAVPVGFVAYHGRDTTVLQVVMCALSGVLLGAMFAGEVRGVVRVVQSRRFKRLAAFMGGNALLVGSLLVLCNMLSTGDEKDYFGWLVAGSHLDCFLRGAMLGVVVGACCAGEAEPAEAEADQTKSA